MVDKKDKKNKNFFDGSKKLFFKVGVELVQIS